MKIGIIGAGNIGAGLAKRLVEHGHEVTLSNSRGPSTLLEVAAATGARTGTVLEAAREARLVIVAIPEKAVSSLPKGLLDGVEVVADTGNYYPGRDGVIPELASQTSTESEWVRKTLGRPVVKVFNNILAQSLVGRGQPKGAPSRIALPVAGDDLREKGATRGARRRAGFRPHRRRSTRRLLAPAARHPHLLHGARRQRRDPRARGRRPLGIARAAGSILGGVRRQSRALARPGPGTDPRALVSRSSA